MDLIRRQSSNDRESDSGFSFKQTRLATHVAAFIRDLVMSGHFAANEKLSIVPLAEQIGVSTTPVREALLVLETEGLVRSEPRRGFYVVPLSPQDVQDLFDLHAVIAGRLAARAAPALTAEGIDQLADLDEKINESAALGQGQLVEELNFQFHRTINHASASRILRRFLSQTTRYIPRRFYAEIPGWTEASAREHEPIVTALRRRDPALAQGVMEEHIRRAGALLAAYLCDQGLVGRLDEKNDGSVTRGEGHPPAVTSIAE